MQNLCPVGVHNKNMLFLMWGLRPHTLHTFIAQPLPPDTLQTQCLRNFNTLNFPHGRTTKTQIVVRMNAASGICENVRFGHLRVHQVPDTQRVPARTSSVKNHAEKRLLYHIHLRPASTSWCNQAKKEPRNTMRQLNLTTHPNGGVN